MNIYKESTFDEVFDSQKNFRILMDAMSRPGKVHKLSKHLFSLYPEKLNPYVLTVLKTLGDNNVKFSIGDSKNNDYANYIEINTGMEYSDIHIADYTIFDGKSMNGDFVRLNTGSLEFPENSSTTIISVSSILSGNQGESSDTLRIRMTGPGIKDVNEVSIKGMDRDYLTQITEINCSFPLGIDVIIIDDDGNVICMSRTTKAEVE